ncbi:Tricarboxylate transport membrane protein TctA [Nitrincola lacisaponensis]|uniref:Tricarboxylate transport membrane protein TctA n=1 Tax=Nitrincola lacisaponensis TaxID=267850 RepID=A0A063Y664_9GAMM|nr:tripartite tricarboxylate transporter permease [Nitrincola lacisaponensis]KDE41169.1 Tricarboxylate transport membrane protein TctA [Nitrincola lacisaponensis]
MDMINNLALGAQTAFTLENLMFCFFGVTLGTLIGVLPGIGALAAISILLPVTFHIPATAAIVMLAGVYYGAQYGGSTAAILLRLPGHPASVVACLDGYPMAQQGRAGAALFMTTIASFIGATVGMLALILFSPGIAAIGLKFGPAEYFALMVLGLIAASILSSGNALRGFGMVVLGLLMGVVGTDVNTGVNRFTFGYIELWDGISLLALAMGMFGLSEVVQSANNDDAPKVKDKITLKSMIPTKQEFRDSVFPMLRGSGIGSFLGSLPGAGASLSSFMSYAVEKKVAKDPSRFGKGAIEGLTAPESANNAGAQTSFIPTLSLGIPGDVVMALILGALIIHGITPGPQLITQQPDLFWGLMVSFIIGNIMLVILNIPMIGIWVSLLRIPYAALYPAILVFISIGVYSVNNNTFDIIMVFIFGVMGYFMSLLRWDAAPLLLGFILGPMMEEHFRRALLLARGDITVFISRPISASLLAVAALIISWAIVSYCINARKRSTHKHTNAIKSEAG